MPHGRDGRTPAAMTSPWRDQVRSVANAEPAGILRFDQDGIISRLE
jgi:hypothetical protein